MTDLILSAILNTDSYKHSHFLQYPPGTTRVSSYVEARKGGDFPEAVVFGLQAFLKAYVTKPVTMADVDEAAAVAKAHGIPFNLAGWRLLVERHGGRLPLEIRAVAEGTVLPEGHVMAEVVNTDPDFFWLTSFIETALLRAIWYPTTVATISWRIRKLIGGYLERTADPAAGPALNFALNDFGSRGVSSLESAALGGMAHLLSFDGTDNLAGVIAASRFYDAPITALSVPAAEHSTITSWGPAQEADAYRNMIEQFAPAFPIIAVVSDSYDLDHAVRALWGRELKPIVDASGSRLVVRPDSGDPTEIVHSTIEALMDAYGATINGKGFRVLPDHVRVIQGDGVEEASIGQILERLEHAGISAENVVFGMGGGLLQKCNRDTLRFAMKCSAAEIDGAWTDVQKRPATDLSKASKAGRLSLVRSEDGAFETVRTDQLRGRTDLLDPVFRDGEILCVQVFGEVQARVRGSV
ncbi:nicotinate phosphoribosyltransferase [Phenylobacterium sp. LjRoot225]|uniref:nicotinate phosphoribosyltransferase n=1 Tax=Phenylobacterium sp. LjRoot225 TaxID=3342285 RepID=UPI003ECF6550